MGKKVFKNDWDEAKHNLKLAFSKGPAGVTKLILRCALIGAIVVLILLLLDI